MLKIKIKPLALTFVALLVAAICVFNTQVGVEGGKARAATNNTINFQARLMTSSGAIVPDGNYNVEFKIYNASTSSGSSQGSCSGDSACLWTETRTSGNVVRVANGYLTVNLGSVTTFPSTINWDQDLWITLNIGGKSVSPSWDGEMSPRLKLTGVPYAFRAGQLASFNGTNTSTLGFATQTAGNSILLPDASGTVCLQSSTSCGFALSSGSGSYIQNTTSLQSGANFNISGTGIAATALQAPFFDVSAAGALGIGTTNATTINVATNNVAHTIHIADGGTSTNQVVTIGSIYSGSSTTIKGGTGSSAIGLTTGTNGKLSISAQGSGGVNALIGSAGFNITTTTNSSTALAIQDASSNYIFSVNTSSGIVTMGAIQATYSGLDGTLNTPFGSLTLGSANNALTLAGNSSMTLQATSGSFATTLSFATPTANRSIVLPDEAGTLCIRNSTNCGFAPTTGSTNYIQNTTTNQSANIAVQAATSGSVTAVLQANAAGTGDILNLRNGSGTNVASVSNTGATLFQNSANSTNAFQISNASANQLLNIDSQNNVTSINGGTSQLGPWRQTNSSPYSLEYSGTASANGFVYMVGGSDGNYRTSTFFAQQNSDGSLGNWQSGTALPAALAATSVVISNNYIYVIGGQASGSVVSTVYYATINPSTGTMGSWTTASNPLPTALGWGTAAVANGYLYYVGGYNGTTNVSSVYYSQLNTSTGAVGAWTTSGSSLPATRDSATLTVYNNYLYFIGGVDSGNDPVSSVYYSQLNTSTGAVGAWTTSSNSLPDARAYHGTIATNGYLYVIGGENASSTQYTSYYAKLNTNGSTTGWSAGASLPSAVSGAAVTLGNNGYIYSIGGWNGDNVSFAYYTSTQNMTGVSGSLTASGAMSIQATSNSANTFQVQNSTGLQMFNVDTSDNVVSLNTNATTNGAASQWGTASYLPQSYDGSASVTVNGTIYYIGGYDGTSYVSDVYYAQASSNGSVGSWKTANSLPAGRGFASAVTLNGYIYVLGGNASGTYSSTVYFAKVNADGSLGSWQTTTSLTGVRAYGAAATANGYIYFTGGKSAGSTFQSTIYYAAPSAANGTISSWTTSSNPMPVTRGQHISMTNNGYLYVIGGTSDGTTFSSTVYYASLNSTTGAVNAWSTTTALPTALGDNTGVAAGGFAYVLGGYTGSSVVNSVYYGQFNSNGTISSWTTSTKTLPQNLNFATAAAVNGYIYAMGGYTGFYFSDVVYASALQGKVSVGGNLSVGGSASFQTGDSQSAFQVQNASGDQLLNIDTVNNAITLNGGVGGALNTWSSTSSLSASTSFGSSLAANGYLYTFGGYGSGYLSTVQYAPINSNGTTGTWATTTALPAVRGYMASVYYGGYVYLIGGSDGSTNVSTIYIAKQNQDGTLGNWITSSTSLPVALNAMSVAAINGHLYVVGGTTGTITSAVYQAHINGDGSLNSFTSGTALPVALANATMVAANGYLYYIGGNNGSSAVSTVYYSAVAGDGDSNSAWTATTSLPTTMSNYPAVVMNGYVYVMRAGVVYRSSFNSDGTLTSWTTENSGIPVSYNGTLAASYNGYIYIMGGYTGSTGTTGVYYTSGPRTYVNGTLDLVGLGSNGAVAQDTAPGSGSLGGSLIAGNTTVMGTLQVQGQSIFNQNVAINGNSLTVGNNLDSSSTGNSIITVQSKGFAGLELYGDSTNDNSAEGGGAYIVYSTDGILGTDAVMGLVQKTDVDPSGTAYTGAVGNDFLMGTRNNFGIQFGTNSSVRMILTNGGNLCIGLTSCTHKLAVSGQIYSTSSTITTGTPDLSETIAAADDVDAMDVVVADPGNSERVLKSSSPYESGMMGVVSDGTSGFQINHLHYGEQDDPNDMTHRVPMTLAGRVYVKVTSEGGDIKPGDYLTSSSTAGYAMKATQAGATIGKALGFFDGDTGKVLVLVNPSYYDPTGGLQGTSDNFQDINISGNAVINNLTVNSVTVSNDAKINGDLTVGGLTNVGDITISGHIVTKGATPKIVTQAAAGNNATVSLVGNDSVGHISIVLGNIPAVGIWAHVTFNKPFDVAPSIVITPVGQGSAQLQPYVDDVTPDGFSIGGASSGQAGSVYVFNYQVLQ